MPLLSKVNSANFQRRSSLTEIAAKARHAYGMSITGGFAAPWWTAVVVTAGSTNHAERYASEIQRRRERGALPAAVPFLVVPDPEGARLGSGGATLTALRALAPGFRDSSLSTLQEWWEGQRVLIVHSGGEARRLPQYSLSGKLFSVLPVRNCSTWASCSTGTGA